MITFDRIVATILILWAFVRTMSYGRWTWRNKNRIGAVMLYLLAIAVLAVPAYQLFFR